MDGVTDEEMLLWCYRASAAAMRADRHSCLATPYAASDPRTAKFFDVVISKHGAPVVCADAGKLKGKAIYADSDLPKNARIWTEPPYVAMQHAQSQRTVPCCQYCFVPLVGDYKQQWTAMAARWNERQHHHHQQQQQQHDQHDQHDHHGTARWPAMATPDDLDEVMERLHVERRGCGLAGAATRCACGDAYCSKLCQIRAYHEFHAILCPRDDPFSAMSMFVRHTRETNDIFLLAAKVIARVLSRYLVTQDLVKAREPMDMFHKKPWWEVVMIEKHVQRRSTGSSDSNGGSSNPGSNSGSSSSGGEDQDSGKRSPPAATFQSMHGDEFRLPLDDMPSSSESRFLKDLLVSTHQLLLDALESNLVHLEREDQLHGHGVDEIWTSCASILSFEFFAAQLGLFEMNNIQVEIDHPFRALMEVLDQDDDAPAGDDDERELFARVLSVLASEENARMREQLDRLKSDGIAPDGDEGELLRSGLLQGYPSIDGTALFSIICTMNHSCDPNCTVLYTKNGDAHVVAVRDIHKGEELCICYIDVDQDVHEREAMLKEYQFRCLCQRCTFERRQLREQRLAREAAQLASGSRLAGAAADSHTTDSSGSRAVVDESRPASAAIV